jgi:hypothetical protein
MYPYILRLLIEGMVQVKSAKGLRNRNDTFTLDQRKPRAWQVYDSTPQRVNSRCNSCFLLTDTR